MQIDKLRKIFQKDSLTQTTNDNFVSIVCLEQFFKNKYQELISLQDECANYLSSILNTICIVELCYFEVKIKFKYGFFEYKTGNIYLTKKGDSLDISVYSEDGKYLEKSRIKDILINNEKLKQFVQKFLQFSFLFNRRDVISGMKTNLGFFVDLNFRDINNIRIMISDLDYSTDYAEYHKMYPRIFKEPEPSIENLSPNYILSLDKKTADDIMNFYFVKNLITGKSSLNYQSEETKDIFDEQLFGEYYLSLKVDISSFTKETQEEIKRFAIISKTKLEDTKAKELEYFRKIQVSRIMKAYEYFKKAIELLNSTKMDLKFERIKLENINQIIFKNNGFPNEEGYIEFEDFFKDNMVLRMLDLSGVDLTNVNIRGLDFSGTNIHINPQTIYKKDMTGVNCTGLKFSPWFDSFDNAILNGAIINDYEAMIDINKLRSYDNSTKICREVILTDNQIRNIK